MVTTSRTYYDPLLKAAVLDEVKASGSVVEVARKRGLEPGLIYNWKNKESDVRKAARKELAQQAKDGKNGVGKNGASKSAGSDRALPVTVAKEPLGSAVASPEGPAITVHALGPWLVSVVKAELPAALRGVVSSVVEAELDAVIERKVSEAIRRVIQKGALGDD
jgi:hypothetical protein